MSFAIMHLMAHLHKTKIGTAAKAKRCR